MQGQWVNPTTNQRPTSLWEKIPLFRSQPNHQPTTYLLTMRARHLPPYERKYLCLEVNPTTNQRPTSLLWEPDTYLLMRDNMTKSTLTTTNPRPTSLWEICLEVIDNDRNRNRISIVDVSNDERDNGDSSPFALLFQHAGVIITTLVAVVIN